MDKVIQEIRQMLAKQQVHSPWMNISDIAKHLSVSESKIRQLVKDCIIPFSRLEPGNPKSTLLFNRKLVDAWLLTGKTKPTKKEKERIKEYIN